MAKPLMNAWIKRMTHPFQDVTVPMAQRDVLSSYLIRYVAVDTVDNQGEPCEKCGLNGARVECNIYAYDMDGNQLTADACSECVFPMIDEVWDTDPTRIVLVERIPTEVATAKGYRS